MRINLRTIFLRPHTKEEYLAGYKKSWEDVLK